jgi:hypothetical protein
MRLPAPPDVPEDQRAHGPVILRYEDVSQDGRLTMEGMPHALGEVFWRPASQRVSFGAILRGKGILPILSRLVTEGGEGPIGVHDPLDGDGRWLLVGVDDDRSEPRQLRIDVWVDLAGKRGRVHGPPPPGAGERIPVGRVVAEHVFTRPFGPAAERRVTAIDGVTPRVRVRWRAPHTLLELPAGARPLDPSPRLQTEPIILGLDDTDSNQHVNSLVYPRLVREAALRHFAEHGRGTGVLARYQETAFRKPCFAGEKLRMAMQAFELDGKLGAVAAVVEQSDARDDLVHGRCFGLVLFEG